MLVPCGTAHASHEGRTVLVGCRDADFRLLAIVPHIEVFQADKNLCADRQRAVQAALGRSDDDCACCILQGQFLVDVPPGVRTGDDAFYLDA